MDNISRSSNGTYRCTAFNGVGEPVNQTLKVIVRCKLHCLWNVSFKLIKLSISLQYQTFFSLSIRTCSPSNLVIVKNSSPYRQFADCLLSVGWLLVICRPTVGQLLTNTLPTVDWQIYLDFSEKITSCRTSVGQQSTDCQLTVGDLSVRCWQSVGRMSVTSCQLLPWKVYDLQPLIIASKRYIIYTFMTYQSTKN